MANVKFEFNGKLSDGRFWDETSNKRVVVELEDNDLSVPEMLEEFMNFMEAIGYKFELGDRFDVVNDFKSFEDTHKKQSQEELMAEKFDPKKHDPIVDEGGGMIGFASKIPSSKITEEELAAEVERIRSGKPGLSEEAYEMAAWTNLANKGV